METEGTGATAPQASEAESGGSDRFRGLAVGLARAGTVVDLFSRPIRRDFATLMAIECAFADHFAERWLGKRFDEEVDNPERGFAVSLSSHQNLATQLRRRAVPFVGAALLYPIAKPVGLISQAAVHLGVSFNGADHNMKQQQTKAEKASGTQKIQPSGRTAEPSPGVRAQVVRRSSTAHVDGYAEAARQRRQSSGHPGNWIKHVVVITPENHTLDNRFGRMEGVDGDPNLFTARDRPDYMFSWWPPHGKFSERHRRHMMVHEQYAPAQLTLDYRLAQNYALFDDHFADQRGPSTGGHLEQGAGYADNVLPNPYGQPGLKQAVDLLGYLSKYPGPQPEMPPFDVDSIFHQAEMAGLSAGIYGNGILAQIEGMKGSPIIMPSEQFVHDWQSGNARSVSYLTPPEHANQHAPWAMDAGQRWEAGILKVIGESPEWKDTLILKADDDYGGYYDHVKPPNVERWEHDERYWYAMGHRVPLTMVGPWVKSGFVSGRDAPLGESDKLRALGSAPELIREVFGLSRLWDDDRPEWTRTRRDPLLAGLQFDKAQPPPDTSLPPPPVIGFLRSLKAPWQLNDGIKARWMEAGNIRGLDDLAGMVKEPLGFHETLQRRIMDSRLAYQQAVPPVPAPTLG